MILAACLTELNDAWLELYSTTVRIDICCHLHVLLTCGGFTEMPPLLCKVGFHPQAPYLPRGLLFLACWCGAAARWTVKWYGMHVGSDKIHPNPTDFFSFAQSMLTEPQALVVCRIDRYHEPGRLTRPFLVLVCLAACVPL